jgi:hypothetical protein
MASSPRFLTERIQSNALTAVIACLSDEDLPPEPIFLGAIMQCIPDPLLTGRSFSSIFCDRKGVQCSQEAFTRRTKSSNGYMNSENFNDWIKVMFVPEFVGQRERHHYRVSRK